MSVEASLLGKDTTYPDTYSPDILFPIARAASRSAYAGVAGVSQGIDWWHVFEVSWLDSQYKPQVAIGRLSIPADSAFLIESKSLKLYFNSLNFKNFNDQEAFIACVEHDLSRVAQAAISLVLMEVNSLPVSDISGVCLDDVRPSAIRAEPDASLLQLDQTAISQKSQEFTLFSHLLRSNCPVTGQPDWGSVFIRYQGIKPCYSALLAYIISYRRHSGFHEQCVEQMFADIWQQLQPEKLMVYAAYTRRGGLDINPCRVSHIEWLPAPIRLARQ